MGIRIEITADTFSQMIQDLGGVVKMFVPIPQQSQEPTPVQPVAEAPVEAEVVDPPKKPRGRPPQTKVIEAEANPTAAAPSAPVAEEPTPTAEIAPTPDKALDFEKDIRPAIVGYVNDMQDPADAGSKKKLFDALVAEFKVARASEIPADKFAAVLDYIKVQRAAAGK